MTTSALILFCPQCDALVLDQAGCGVCDWRRPATNAAPGDILWQTALTGRLGDPYSLLAAANGLLFVGLEIGQRSAGRQCVLIALDVTTGQEQWRYSLPDGRLTQSPIAAGDFLLLGPQDVNPLPQPDNALLALTMKGELAWKCPIPAHSLSTPAIQGQRLFFTANNGGGYIVNLSDGRLQAQTDNLPAWTPAAPTAGDNAFYIGSRGPQMAAVAAADGRTTTLFRAENDDSSFTMPPVYHQGVVYAACWDKHLYAIEAETGRLRWRTPLGRGISSPPVVGRFLYIGVKERSADDRPTYGLHALNLENGEQIWRFQTDKHVETPAGLQDDFVFVSSRGGHFYALDAPTGALQWQFSLAEDRVVTPPVIVGDHLFVGARKGQIMAVAWRQRDALAELLTAASYRQEEKWQMAGIAAALAGEWLAAAADFERLERPYHAAQLYEKGGDWQRAAANYRQAERPQEAIAAYRQAEDKVGEAAVRLTLNDLPAAAALYESAGLYAEAAELFVQTGLLERAVACRVQAGQLAAAAELYLALEQPTAAARLYRQIGDQAQAVAVLQNAGLITEAAQLLVDDGRYAAAAQLLEEAQQINEAAAIWQEQGDWEAAAQLYERDRQWPRAAELYIQAGKLEQAAKLYQEDNQLSRAAELYIRLKAPRRAAALYRQLEDAAELARLAEQNEDWLNAANAYLVMRPPQPLAAARCFQLAGEWAEAARLYQEAGDLDQAAPLWLQAGRPDKVVKALRQAGRLTEAAQLWQEQGQYAAAAELWLEIDRTDEAIRLYLLADEKGKALALVEAAGDWEQARQLAHQMEEYEREALACVKLLASARPHEAIDLHLLAAGAFQKTAEQAEQKGGQQATAIAALWEQAASHYEEAFESEKAAACTGHINRLRRWPELTATIKESQLLVAGEWHTLTIQVANVGYGVAATIAVRLISDNFDGDNTSTRHLRGLRAGQEVELLLRVQPKKEAVGSSVPLDMEVAYVCHDRTLVTKKISGQVAVRHADTPVTPLPRSSAALPASGMVASPIPADLPAFAGDPTQLHALLVNQFDEQELITICFNLKLSYEDLAGSGRANKARELIVYLDRRGRLNELLYLCQQERPHLFDA
jgi:outer membrane protein assembly factor BamB